MPALVLLGRQLLIASDDVPLFALPAALFHSAWTIVLIVTLTLYQQHPVCRDEGDYLPFLAGGTGAFVISSVLEWSLFSVGLTGTPLETHARQAVPLLLYLHTFASLAELGFAAYGAHLLRVDTRLCIAWSPRPLAAALVGTTWAVIALNGLLTGLALNPWHGLGLVEAWEARLLWLSRLLCCRSRILTHTRVPDREPALRRIAQLTSHLLQHVDLTLSDVATAMILVAAAQRERRRRALRDAMVAAAAAHAALLAPGGSAAVAAAAADAGVGVGVGAGTIVGPGLRGSCTNATGVPPAALGSGSTAASAAGGVGPKGLRGPPAAAVGPASTGVQGVGGALRERLTSGGGASAIARGVVAAAAVTLDGGGCEGGLAAGLSPFLAVQQPQAQPHPPQPPQPPHPARHPHARVRFPSEEDGTELGPMHLYLHAPALRLSSGGTAEAAAPPQAPAPSAMGAAASAPLMGSSGGGGSVEFFIATPSHAQDNPLLSPVTSAINNDGANVEGRAPPSDLTAAAAAEDATLPSPSHALTMMHPIVHITPAGMEEHLDELVGELVGELAAEAAEADADAEVEAGEAGAGRGGGGLLSGGPAVGSLDLDLDVNLELHLKEGRLDAEEPGGGGDDVRVMSNGSAAAAVAAVAAAAAEMVVTNAAAAAAALPPSLGSRRTGPAATAAASPAATATAAPPPPVAPQTSAKTAALRKRIGDAALAAAFAAEREMVDRETLQEAALYGRYAAAIYGSCPPDSLGKSAAWHLGGDGDGDGASAPDEVWAWRRRHGSSAPDPLLASILSSASRCTEHVVHVNTHNSTEGYLPYMVCLDKPTRSVVIAIRGTFSAEDIVTDCLCEPFDVRHLLSGDTAPMATAASSSTAAAAAAAGAAPAPAPAGAADDPLLANRRSSAGVAAASGTFSGDAATVAGMASGGGGGGVAAACPGDEPVLVHAGIWAAADVIWEDLRELQLLQVLLPPPPGRTDGRSTNGGVGSPAGAETATASAAVASASAPARASTGPAAAAAAPNGNPAAGRGRGTGGGGSPPDLHPNCRRREPSPPPPMACRQQPSQGQARGVEPQRAPSSGLQKQTRLRESRSISAPRPAQPQRQQHQHQHQQPERQPSLRRRPASLDEDRPAADGPQHAAAYGASGAAADPWVGHHATADVSRRHSAFAGPHLPRLISAERQATMPHGSGLSVLLQRHRLQHQRLPPPPPPAAALLPSLVLSYHPPGRATSTRLSGGGGDGGGGPAAARPRRRLLLPTALRRRSSTTDGGGGERRSVAKCSSGEGGDADNDPRAPLLLSPPPAASTACAQGHSYYSPTGAPLLLPARAAAIASPPDASGRHSFDVGFRFWRTCTGGQEPATSPSPSRLATAAATAGGGRPSGLPPPPLPPPPVASAAAAAAATATRQPSGRTLQPQPQGPIALRGAPRGGAGGASAAPGPLGPSRHPRKPSGTFGRPSGVGRPPGDPAAAAAPPVSIFGRLQRAAAGLVRAASGLVLPRRGPAGAVAAAAAAGAAAAAAAPRLQQEQERGKGQAHVVQRRLGWLGSYGGRSTSASEGGAQLPYMSLARTEAEAEREAGGAAVSGGGGGGVSAFDALGRRWRSVGGAALGGDARGGGGRTSGADGGVVDGWSMGGPYPYRAIVDLEAPPPGAAAGNGDVEEEEDEEVRQTATPPLRLPEVDCTGWRLVVTGHSLGAGAAALLALRLRSALPHVEVRCWSFAPPGSLASPALSEALRPFTVSVVTGKDLIPRLSLNTMERYRDEMITALARCRCSKARVLVGSFSRRNRLRRAAHLLLPYEEIPAQARRLLRSYHEAVQRAGRLPELHPPGRILYLQPSARVANGGNRRSASATGGGAAGDARAGGSGASASAPHYRPVWVSARELQCEGILASTRMLVDHSLTLCTLPALDEILRA